MCGVYRESLFGKKKMSTNGLKIGGLPVQTQLEKTVKGVEIDSPVKNKFWAW